MSSQEKHTPNSLVLRDCTNIPAHAPVAKRSALTTNAPVAKRALIATYPVFEPPRVPQKSSCEFTKDVCQIITTESKEEILVNLMKFITNENGDEVSYDLKCFGVFQSSIMKYAHIHCSSILCEEFHLEAEHARHEDALFGIADPLHMLLRKLPSTWAEATALSNDVLKIDKEFCESQNLKMQQMQMDLTALFVQRDRSVIYLLRYYWGEDHENIQHDLLSVDLALMWLVAVCYEIWEYREYGSFLG